MLNSITLGFVAGAFHVVSGPDHLIAVGPLTLRRNQSSWLCGLVWGAGHSVGVGIIGLLYCLFSESGIILHISLGAEKLVGIGLICIGIVGLQMIFRHQHSSNEGLQQGNHTAVALGFGVLHGSAGAHHLIGLLPLLAFEDIVSIVIYLLTYCLGTVIAMCCFTHLFQRFACHLISKNQAYFRKLMFTCSIAALMIGSLWLIY